MGYIYHHRNQQTPPANTFGNDDLNRLTTANYLAGTAGTESFSYDLLGNRIPQTGNQFGYKDTRPNPDVICSYEHNLANEYTSVCGTPVLYDAAGNLTQDKRLCPSHS